MTVSLPREMMEQVELARKAEQRTRSELVREALRVYLSINSVLPTYTPTRRELRAIERGRRAIARGDYITLDELRASLAAHSGKVRRKNSRARASSRG